MEICEFSGDGYMPLTAYGSWRVAIINACERLREENLRRMERHLGTDEVFILLEGEAALYIGAEKKRFPMEIGKLYCVKCGEWHCISMASGAKAAVVENNDVGEMNTEYLYFTS